MSSYDTIVIGLGAMGSAAAWRCAQRGQRVLGLEQFDLVHQLGSSHGRSRIIREAYYEHPAYVPLVREAYALWNSLSEESQYALLTPCHCANIGPAGCEIITGVRVAAKEHQLPVEVLNARELMLLYPAFHLPEHYQAVVESNAGWLQVETCVHVMQLMACRHGAVLHANEMVLEWKAVPGNVTVRTNSDTYHARQLILTAGPWSRDLLCMAGVPLTVMRQLQWFFKAPITRSDEREKQTLPIFIIDTPAGSFYGIPAEHIWNGSKGTINMKIAQHYGAPEQAHPDEVNRQIADDELIPVRKFMQQYLPAMADAELQSASVCIYTLSPDRHFVIDRHPNHENVALACGFSGHGFKFAPVVGEQLANLLEGKVREETRELFGIDRLLKP
ncbi:MAG: N-methyl-L-tryptophan oxidase [Gemmatales bacterium]